MLRAHRKRAERRRKVKNGKGERIGVNWKGGSKFQFTARCDKTRQILSFFLMKRKESLQEKEEEGRKRGGEGEGEGGGGKVVDIFQRYYKLSECSCSFSTYVSLLLSQSLSPSLSSPSLFLSFSLSL